MKKVSVIITTYGGGNEVVRAVNSVLCQTYKNVELIVVDDNGQGTEDQIKTEGYLSDLIKENKLIYIPHEVNKNGSAARNTGFKNSTGEFIMFLDDDDEFTPARIEKQLSVLTEEYGASYCSYEKRNADGSFYSRVRIKKSGDILYNTLMHIKSPTTDNMMIRRECFEAIGGFDESFVRHQDWEMSARLAGEYKFAAMRDIGVIVNMQFRNQPQNIEKYTEIRHKYLDKTAFLRDKLSNTRKKRVLAENLYDIAMQHLKVGGVSAFLKEYKKVGMGIYGIEFIFRRAYLIISQKVRSKLCM